MKSELKYENCQFVYFCLFLFFIPDISLIFESTALQFVFATLVQFSYINDKCRSSCLIWLIHFFFFFYLWAWIDINVLVVMRRRRAVWSGPFTFRLRPQLISSWIKGHRVGKKRREDTELTWATAPFLSFPDALIEAEHLKTLHYAQSHIYV